MSSKPPTPMPPPDTPRALAATAPVVPLEVDDLDAIRRLQPASWTDIVPKFEAYTAQDFSHPVKIVADDEIIAIGAGIDLSISGWIAHLVVDPSLRRRGLGGRVLTHLVDALRRAAVRSICLMATAAGEPLYRREGFEPVGDYLFFHRARPWRARPPPAGVRPYPEADREAVARLDREASGETRMRVLAPHLRAGFVCVEGGEVEGYHLPTLIEGPIVARTASAGRALMAHKYATADTAVRPADNLAGRDFLREAGFAERPVRERRMVLGPPLAWRPDHVFGRIGGNLG